MVDRPETPKEMGNFNTKRSKKLEVDSKLKENSVSKGEKPISEVNDDEELEAKAVTSSAQDIESVGDVPAISETVLDEEKNEELRLDNIEFDDIISTDSKEEERKITLDSSEYEQGSEPRTFCEYVPLNDNQEKTMETSYSNKSALKNEERRVHKDGMPITGCESINAGFENLDKGNSIFKHGITEITTKDKAAGDEPKLQYDISNPESSQNQDLEVEDILEEKEIKSSIRLSSSHSAIVQLSNQKIKSNHVQNLPTGSSFSDSNILDHSFDEVSELMHKSKVIQFSLNNYMEGESTCNELSEKEKENPADLIETVTIVDLEDAPETPDTTNLISVDPCLNIEQNASSNLDNNISFDIVENIESKSNGIHDSIDLLVCEEIDEENQFRFKRNVKVPFSYGYKSPAMSGKYSLNHGTQPSSLYGRKSYYSECETEETEIKVKVGSNNKMKCRDELLSRRKSTGIEFSEIALIDLE